MSDHVGGSLTHAFEQRKTDKMIHAAYLGLCNVPISVGSPHLSLQVEGGRNDGEGTGRSLLDSILS